MAASLLLLLPAALFVTVGLVVLVVLALTARPGHTLPSEVAAARRHALATSVVAEIAFVAAVASLVWMATRPGSGYVRTTPIWLGSLPLIGAGVAIAVLAVGELAWPRPRGAQRQVNLNPRTVRDLVPRTWGLALTGFGLFTVAVVGLGWWAADPSGHSLSRADGEVFRATASPFPGAEYGRAQLVAIGIALLMLLGVLRLVVLRPAVVRSDVATDNRLRAASAVRAVRVVVSALALTSAGNLFFGGSTAVRLYDPGWQQYAGGGAMLLGAALGVVGILLVLAPAPRLPQDRRSPTPDAPVTASA